MSRQQERGDLPPEVRIRMAEDDLDRVDREFVETVGKIEHAKGNWRVVADDLARKFEKLETETETKVDGNRKIMVGVLVSTLSVAIAIVAQVLLMRGGT